MNIAGREIGPGYPCFIVAEISCNHMGNIDNALRLIDEAKTAGADAVKIQAWTLDEILTVRGVSVQAAAPWDRYTNRQLFIRARTPLDWLPELFAHARQQRIILFSSFMGPKSLRALEEVGCPAYKMARPECRRYDMAQGALATGKPVIASIRDDDHNLPPDVHLLYCPPGYPAPRDTLDLGALHRLPVIGLSSHCILPEVAIAALKYGANVLEYHIMLPETWPLDEAFSLTPAAFRQMVQQVRAIEAMR